MNARKIQKPRPGDYPPYAEMYMKALPDDGQILQHLEKSFDDLRAFILTVPSEKLLYRYEPGKWTIKEILVHLIDDERIYAYRALRFARQDPTALPGFDQDAYAMSSRANERLLESILEEYEAVRRSTLALFRGLPEESLVYKGTGSGSFFGATVRALLFHIAGHEIHHLNLIKKHYL